MNKAGKKCLKKKKELPTQSIYKTVTGHNHLVHVVNYLNFQSLDFFF